MGFQLFSAGARVGLPIPCTKHIELIPTIGARGGVIRTSAVGFAAPQNESLLLGAVGPGVLARVELGRSVVLEGLLDFELILRRDRFHVRERDALHLIHEPRILAPRFALGLAYDFR